MTTPSALTRRMSLVLPLVCAAPVLLTGCGGSTTVTGPTSTASSAAAAGSSSATTSSASPSTGAAQPSGEDAAIGPDGAGATRFEKFGAHSGVVLDGSTLTLVYRNGLRYQVDISGVGAAVPGVTVPGVTVPGMDAAQALRDGETAVFTTAAGVTTIDPDGSATVVNTATGATSTLEPDGSGTVIDGKGTIVVGSDGQVTCVGAQGVQVLDSDGSATSVGPAGVLVLDGKGGSTAVGARAAGGVQPAGRFSVCGIAGTMTIDLSGDVLFDFDSDQLKPAAAAVVKQTAAMIRANAKGGVTVVGHTDAKGSDSYNLDLSQRRARTVATALQRALGAKVAISATGAGERQPVAANTGPDGSDDPRGRAQNRRVAISFRR